MMNVLQLKLIFLVKSVINHHRTYSANAEKIIKDHIIDSSMLLIKKMSLNNLHFKE